MMHVTPLERGAPPRPKETRLLDFRNRDNLLQLERRNGTYDVEVNKVSLFPDYTLMVQQQSMAFSVVKWHLQTFSSTL